MWIKRYDGELINLDRIQHILLQGGGCVWWVVGLFPIEDGNGQYILEQCDTKQDAQNYIDSLLEKLKGENMF